jgi:transposase
MKETLSESHEMLLLKTLPGIGLILSTVILSEVGDVARFPSAAQYASYAGTTPRVSASGDKIHYGRIRPDVNRYLKWAYMEAGNHIAVNQRSLSHRHVAKLYQRIRNRKGHQKAMGAVARHLAEATYWVLSKREPYREPRRKVLSTEGQARTFAEPLSSEIGCDTPPGHDHAAVTAKICVG